MNRPRISVFIPSLRGGGVERVVVNLANEFIKRGYSIELVLASYEGELVNALSSNIKVINFNRKRVIYCLPLLIKYYISMRPTVLLSAMEHTNLVSIMAKILSRVPVKIVISVHTNIDFAVVQRKNIFSKILLICIKIFYRYADEIISVTKKGIIDIKRAANIKKKHIHSIYNPILTDIFYEQLEIHLTCQWITSSAVPIILSAGRLDPVKDFITLIKAFAVVIESINCRLVIIGEGVERKKLESLIVKLGLEDSVLLPGFVNNPFSYMKYASVFVLSSLAEGFGNVLVEAMACKLPIISTDCPMGPREILTDKGTLVPIENFEIMADQIRKVLSMPKIVNYPINRIMVFETDGIIDKYLSVLLGK